MAIARRTGPKAAAAVKELLADATSTTPVSHAAYLKTAADSAADANWCWYECVPLDSTAAPHDATTVVVADGMGSSGERLLASYLLNRGDLRPTFQSGVIWTGASCW